MKNKGHDTRRCENCGGKFVYVRIKTNQIVCRSCGFISKLKKTKKSSEKSGDNSDKSKANDSDELNNVLDKLPE